ncbi:MAG: pantoate--beta-alanine ligase [Gammaproteobacteria bacterium]|nr:pantoate--beta-alanine ligase [Gammaproteobacteria bacterium]
MLQHQSIQRIRAQVRQWRVAGETLALVPTMGNLHRGHLHLVDVAKKNADRVVVSVFVNPLQFVPGTDFENYPRTLDHDIEKLVSHGIDAVFVPEVESLFANAVQSTTKVSVPELSNVLCGRFRPGHFDGVTTIVTKLFNIIQPDVAVFGEKDYQQLVIIKRMVADLSFATKVLGVETIRESGGLAMSSRNQYLTQDQHENAINLYKVLLGIVRRIKALRLSNALSDNELRCIEQQSLQYLSDLDFKPDYIQICDATRLTPATTSTKNMRVLAAAWLGEARLIDNLAV